MAVIAFQRLSQLVTDYILGNSGSITPPASWTIGLSTTAVATMARASAWNAAISGTNINELGSTATNGYGRITVARSIAQAGVDWGTSTFDSTLSTGGQSSVADQVTFGPFSSTGPNPNGANSWVLTDGTTLNAGQVYCAGDLAVTRTFATGDTEKVTATLKAG